MRVFLSLHYTKLIFFLHFSLSVSIHLSLSSPVSPSQAILSLNDVPSRTRLIKEALIKNPRTQHPLPRLLPVRLPSEDKRIPHSGTRILPLCPRASLKRIMGGNEAVEQREPRTIRKMCRGFRHLGASLCLFISSFPFFHVPSYCLAFI